jgi:exopolyphosphatase/guanosine-5'-triphosphate,3'-diphosphate pyrophosphatase
LLHDPAKGKEVERMREYIAEQVNRIAPAIRRYRVDLAIATSGTAAALAGAARAAQGRSKYAHTVSRSMTTKLARELASSSIGERARYSGIGPRRAEIIVAGAFVFSELMAHYGLPSFQYSPLGLRDGLLAQMAADADIGTREHRQLEAEREDALNSLSKRYNTDTRHATQVRDLAMQLFDSLREVHRLPPEYAHWIAAAAMLHELGSYVNRSGRHRHTWYLIANSEIFGFSPDQRHIIAAIARYMGKSRPSERDREVRNLRPSARELLDRAVVLLRLARALNQGRRGIVQRVRSQHAGPEVLLQLRGKADMDLEVWTAEKERAYFRDVFGRNLLVKAAT